jgi:shikimate dehydrogenase
MAKRYGLIGHPLTHSFSKKYFERKFINEKLNDCSYELFDIADIALFEDILQNNSGILGLNVTIPYKELVIPYLNQLDSSAKKVGAVNVIKVENNVLAGYNSDFYGFQKSLTNWLSGTEINKALIFGTGGASKAVCAVLNEMNITYQLVSRSNTKGNILYTDLTNNEIIKESKLLINTTPLGTYPNTYASVPIPFDEITPSHYVFDLIYNPSVSQLLEKAASKGANIKNGLEMLELQAEKSWEIWNS